MQMPGVCGGQQLEAEGAVGKIPQSRRRCEEQRGDIWCECSSKSTKWEVGKPGISWRWRFSERIAVPWIAFSVIWDAMLDPDLDKILTTFMAQSSTQSSAQPSTNIASSAPLTMSWRRNDGVSIEFLQVVDASRPDS